MRPYMATNLDGPYAEKLMQVKDLPTGTLITWGYQVKWVDPLVMMDIDSGRIAPGYQIWLCSMTLGDADGWMQALRKAEIIRIKVYGCPNCDTATFVRIDMVLLDEKDGPQTKPAQGNEDYLFSW